MCGWVQIKYAETNENHFFLSKMFSNRKIEDNKIRCIMIVVENDEETPTDFYHKEKFTKKIVCINPSKYHGKFDLQSWIAGHPEGEQESLGN